MSVSSTPPANLPAKEPRQSAVTGALRDALWEISYSLASLMLGHRSHRMR